MNELIFFVFLIFIILPFIKKAINNSNNLSQSKRRSRKSKWGQSNWGQTHGQIKTNLQKQMRTNDDSNGYQEERQAHTRDHDRREGQEYRKAEVTNQGRNNQAMTKVGNKSRHDWGIRGESGMTSSKTIVTVILLALLAHFIIAGFFPELVPGNS